MADEKFYALKKLQEAFDRLKEGSDKSSNELERDGVIQRFEFTFELMWKALKIYLEKEGLFQNTPRESFKVAFKIGWVKDETGFLLIIEDRNKTSHIYSKQQSEEIFKRIQTQHIGNISSLIDVLKNKLD